MISLGKYDLTLREGNLIFVVSYWSFKKSDCTEQSIWILRAPRYYGKNSDAQQKNFDWKWIPLLRTLTITSAKRCPDSVRYNKNWLYIANTFMFINFYLLFLLSHRTMTSWMLELDTLLHYQMDVLLWKEKSRTIFRKCTHQAFSPTNLTQFNRTRAYAMSVCVSNILSLLLLQEWIYKSWQASKSFIPRGMFLFFVLPKFPLEIMVWLERLSPYHSLVSGEIAVLKLCSCDISSVFCGLVFALSGYRNCNFNFYLTRWWHG